MRWWNNMAHFILEYYNKQYEFLESENVTLEDVVYASTVLLNEVFFRWMMDSTISAEEKKQLIKFTLSSMENSFFRTYKEYLPGGNKAGLEDTMIN